MLHEEKEGEGQQRQKERGRKGGRPRDIPLLKKSWKVTKQRDFAKINLQVRSVDVPDKKAPLAPTGLHGPVRTTSPRSLPC